MTFTQFTQANAEHKRRLFNQLKGIQNQAQESRAIYIIGETCYISTIVMILINSLDYLIN